MNPLAVLLPALHAKLTSPELLVNGAVVPVKEYFPLNQPGHYVEVTQPTDTDAGGGAHCPQFDCTVLLNVVTQFAGRTITRVPAESIVTQINERLRGQRLALPDGWDCSPGILSALQVGVEKPDQLLSIRRLLRYRWTLTYHIPAVAPVPAGYLNAVYPVPLA